MHICEEVAKVAYSMSIIIIRMSLAPTDQSINSLKQFSLLWRHSSFILIHYLHHKYMFYKAVCCGVSVTFFNYKFLKLDFDYYVLARHLEKENVQRPTLVADPWTLCVFGKSRRLTHIHLVWQSKQELFSVRKLFFQVCALSLRKPGTIFM